MPFVINEQNNVLITNSHEKRYDPDLFLEFLCCIPTIKCSQYDRLKIGYKVWDEGIVFARRIL